MEPIDDRGYGATLGSGLWVQSMIGVMEPLSDPIPSGKPA